MFGYIPWKLGCVPSELPHLLLSPLLLNNKTPPSLLLTKKVRMTLDVPNHIHCTICFLSFALSSLSLRFEHQQIDVGAKIGDYKVRYWEVQTAIWFWDLICLDVRGSHGENWSRSQGDSSYCKSKQFVELLGILLIWWVYLESWRWLNPIIFPYFSR